MLNMKHIIRNNVKYILMKNIDDILIRNIKKNFIKFNIYFYLVFIVIY